MALARGSNDASYAAEDLPALTFQSCMMLFFPFEFVWNILITLHCMFCGTTFWVWSTEVK